jgi:hypothetical protein
MLMYKCEASNTPLELALMEHRNTPFAINLPSPSELAHGRKLRTLIPYQKRQLVQSFHPREEVMKRYEEYKRNQKSYYDRGARQMNNLTPGQQVLVQQDNKWMPATIQNTVDGCPRSYVLRRPNGIVIRRNRRHLKELRNNDVECEEELTHEETIAVQSPEKERVPCAPSSRYSRAIRPPCRYGFS